MRTILARMAAVIRSPVFWGPALAFLMVTAGIRATDADRAAIRPFYCADGTNSADPDACWPWKNTQPWKGLYDFGELPALVIGCGGLVAWVVSFAVRQLEPWRDPGLFLALVLIIGPGILVNVVMKPFWARPRPNATVEFGGASDFIPVGQLGREADNWSFPSGHAAMGFFFLSFAFLCWRSWPWRAAVLLAFGIAFGLMMGLARIVAGCHFPSDVLWAGAIVYFTALLMAAPFGPKLGGTKQGSEVGDWGPKVAGRSNCRGL
jgi:lipid A 4'-phosphatase